jgi:hypothetical protein
MKKRKGITRQMDRRSFIKKMSIAPAGVIGIGKIIDPQPEKVDVEEKIRGLEIMSELPEGAVLMEKEHINGPVRKINEIIRILKGE